MASHIENHIQFLLLDIQEYLSEILTFLSSMGWSLRVMCLHVVSAPVSTDKVASGYSWQILADAFQILSYVLSYLLFALSCEGRLPQAPSPYTLLRTGITWLLWYYYPLVIPNIFPYASPFISQFPYLFPLTLLNHVKNHMHIPAVRAVSYG